MDKVNPEMERIARLQSQGAKQGGARASHEEIVERWIDQHQPSPAAAEAYRNWFRTYRMQIKPRHRAVLDQGRALDVTVNGMRIAATAWGEGPVVLLMHGLHGHRGQMTKFVAPLLAEGLQPVAFDAPAHGDNVGNTTDLYEVYDTIQAVIAEVGEFFGVVACSFGNTWALYALAEGVPVQRVVSLCPPAEQGFLFNTFRTIHSLSDDVAEEFIRLHHGKYGPFERYDNTGFASRIRAPALVFHDPGDEVIPYAMGGERLAAAWEGARFVQTQGISHFRMMRDDGVIQQAVAFLAEGC